MTYIRKSLYFCTSEAKKAEGRECAAYGCRNKPCAKKRGLCHGHYTRYRKTVDPVYERYHDFKKNALARCKEFTITLQEFRDWCKKEGYLEKGRRGRAATIDRVKNEHGYHIWNIQILSGRANVIKYHEVDKHHENYTPF